MNPWITEDAIFLAMTFLIAMGLTTAILVWGGVAWGPKAR